MEFRKESYVWRLDTAIRVHESYFSVRVGGVCTFKISAQRFENEEVQGSVLLLWVSIGYQRMAQTLALMMFTFSQNREK